MDVVPDFQVLHWHPQSRPLGIELGHAQKGYASGVADVMRRMARNSLAPFPRTRRWHEVMAARNGDDVALVQVRKRFQTEWSHPETIRIARFLVALPVCSRYANPDQVLAAQFAIDWHGDVLETFQRMALSDSDAQRAGRRALSQILGSPLQYSSEASPWDLWRTFDGGAFCELSGAFFAALLEEVTRTCVGDQTQWEELATLSRELTRITWSFSARWYHKCVKDQNPDANSVRWFLRHSFGKIDLELEREEAARDSRNCTTFRRQRAPKQPVLFDA
jgi:hypothetical protein